MSFRGVDGDVIQSQTVWWRGAPSGAKAEGFGLVDRSAKINHVMVAMAISRHPTP
ncbi:hypothetical protein A2U01_0089338 [Trifolium medium]|uniref:Uncharacterized protein n=1 Tax=Trifolium medium TaxID=97028 RepID=A0A392U3R9_9FABA|nr:hypothetical protein [Trifolium medium]